MSIKNQCMTINSQIKTFHPNLQPRDIFYPLTFSAPWLCYKPPDKIDTFCSKSDCSIKINTVEPLLNCYTVPSLYQPVTDVQADISKSLKRLFKRSTSIKQPLVPFPKSGCTINVVRSFDYPPKQKYFHSI